MNKYLEKIAISWKQETDIAGKAGKAILADKVGDVTGLAAGGYVGSKFDNKENKDPNKFQHKGALVGAGIIGSALMYASMRKDLLKGLGK